MIFVEKNLLLQSDVVFDFESNERNFSSLAPPDGEIKNYLHFLKKKTEKCVFSPRVKSSDQKINRRKKGINFAAGLSKLLFILTS